MINNKLRQARLIAGLSQDEVVRQLEKQGTELSKAALSKYERGKSTPRADLLIKLARVLNVKLDYFFHEPSVAVNWLAFRKHADLAKSRQKRIKLWARDIIEKQIELNKTLYPDEEPDFPKPVAVSSGEEAERTAENLRSHWEVGTIPIESLTELAEDRGAIVIECSEEEGKFDGLAGWANEKYPVIVTSGAVSPDRRRFNLAHELGHLLMDAQDVSEKEEEKLAHRFAAALIAPRVAVYHELGRTRNKLTLSELGLLKEKYGLSMQGWIYRALDLNIISQSHANNLFRLFSAKGWRKHEPVAFRGNEIPVRLYQMRERSLAEGIITETQAQEILPQIIRQKLQQSVDREGFPTSVELMKLPREEREKYFQISAAEAEELYKQNPDLQELMEFQALEDFIDESE